MIRTRSNQRPNESSLWSHKQQLTSRRGAMLPLIALCLPLFVIMAAFAVDVAWMQLVRTELRTATDAASRAGAQTLSLKQNVPDAEVAAIKAASLNSVAGKNLLLKPADLQFGVTQAANGFDRFGFTPGGDQVNAVRVIADQNVSLLFAGILGETHFQPTQTAISSQLDRDICLVIDRSGSMMFGINSSGFNNLPGGRRPCDPPHPSLSRWAVMQAAVTLFLDELNKTDQVEKVSMASYGSSVQQCGRRYLAKSKDVDLTDKYGEIAKCLKKLGEKPAHGGTSISAGIEAGIDLLISDKSRPLARKTMIVLTDGIHNVGESPTISAQRAKDLGITVHTITFSNFAAQNQMQQVAQIGEGQHFHAPNALQLARIFKEIASTLPVLTTE